MSRYIDAYALRQKWLFRGKDGKPYRDEIDAMPTADVKPVVRGEWMREYTLYGVLKDTFWHCSVCGYKNSDSFANFDHKYCPNCGAKMST